MDIEDKSEYRIFISHSSADADKVEVIKDVLESNGLKPFYSDSFHGGDNFFELIENYIAHSHIFLPIISESSSKRGWVHQEIGIATALHVPIIPISIDKLPEQMMHHLHAIPWDDDKNKMKKSLSFDLFNSKVMENQYKTRPFSECGITDQDRTNMIVEYARNVLSFGDYGLLRQLSRMSSFHIPDTYPDDPILNDHFGSSTRSGSNYESLIDERMVLEEHARTAGCKLIINPCETVKRYGCEIAGLRIVELINFLESMDDDNVEIAIKGQTMCGVEDYHDGLNISDIDKNLTIVGDWFLAESILSPNGSGHPWTMFIKHAPTVVGSIKNFDKELNILLNKQDRDGLSSRMYVINQLKLILDRLH